MMLMKFCVFLLCVGMVAGALEGNMAQRRNTLEEAKADTGYYTAVGKEPATTPVTTCASGEEHYYAGYSDYSDSWSVAAKVISHSPSLFPALTVTLLNGEGVPFGASDVTTERSDSEVLLKLREPYRGKFILKVTTDQTQDYAVQLFGFVYL